MTRNAGQLAEEAHHFNRQIEQGASFNHIHEDFEEVAEAYALAQNELAVRADVGYNRRVIDDFREVEVAFADLNRAIDYSAGHYYGREAAPYYYER